MKTRQSPIVNRQRIPVAVLVTVVVGLAACELEEIAIPGGEEILIVHAVMRPDQQRQFVLVESSWRGEVDPADLDRFDLPPNSPQLPVEGAVVNGRERLRAPVAVAQFGTLLYLPDGVGGLESNVQLSYYPETGAIERVSVATRGLQEEDVEKLGDAIGAFIEKLSGLGHNVEKLTEGLEVLEQLKNGVE